MKHSTAIYAPLHTMVSLDQARSCLYLASVRRILDGFHCVWWQIVVYPGA